MYTGIRFSMQLRARASKHGNFNTEPIVGSDKARCHRQFSPLLHLTLMITHNATMSSEHFMQKGVAVGNAVIFRPDDP